MFGLFKSPPFVDVALGKLIRSRGLWRGTMCLCSSGEVPLALAGTRAAPDKTAILVARDLPVQYHTWRPVIERALFEHYEPYADLLADIISPSQIWPYASLVFVSVTGLGGKLTVEIGYGTEWDEEHTLGARFQDGHFLELCGSTVRD